MRWRRIAFWSGFGLLSLIVLAVSWLFLADLGVFKHHIERWASETTGREVAIDGELKINLAAQSSVVAEGIYIGNADWADDPAMLTVGRLEVQLQLGSLFRGPIVIDLIDLDDAQISLARPEQGDPNWVLGDAAAESAPATDDDAKGFLVKQIDIDNVSLSYAAPNRSEPLELLLERFEQQHRQDDFLELSVAGMLNNKEFNLDGELGSWAGLLGKRDVQFNLGGRLDDFTLNASGHIDDLLQPHRPQIDFTAAAPDVNDVLQVLGVAQRGEGKIDLVGSLSAEGQGPLVLDVSGVFGRLTLEAAGKFSDLQDLENVDLKLLASGEDVRPILEAFGLKQNKPAPFMMNVDAARQGSTFIIEQADMVFGQARFELSARLPEFPRVDDGLINLRINGPDIERFRDVFNLPGAATGPFSVGFKIDVAEDGLELLNLELQTSLASMQANGRLGDAPEFFGSSLDFELHSPSLATIGSAYGVERLPDEPLEVRGSATFGPEGIQSREPLQVTVNDVAVRVDGLIKPVQGLLGSDFEFELNGPSLAELIGAFAEGDSVPELPYALHGQLQIRDDGYRFREVNGKVGTSDVEVDGLLVPRSQIIGSRFNFSAQGAAFTELVARLGEFDVAPGPYTLGGSVVFGPETIKLDNFELDRATGSVDVDFELGMPVSRRWANLNMRASGPNVRALLKTVDNFEADEAPFLIDIEGTLRDTTWSVDNLDVSVGQATLRSRGTLDLKGQTSVTEFLIDLDVPNVAALGTLDGRRLSEQSLTLDASVAGGDQEVHVNDFSLRLGPSDIRGDVSYQVADIPRLDLRVKSESVIVEPLLVPLEDYDPEPEFDDGRLIPDVKIPFEAMATLNAGLKIDIASLQRDTLLMRDIVVRAQLEDGELQIEEAGFQGVSGALTARARLSPAGGTGHAELQLVAREFALGMSEMNRDAAMRGDIDITLEGAGGGLREILGNSNGVLFFNARGGRMLNNRFLHALYGNLLDEIIGTINPFAKDDEYTDFECVIVPVELNDGLLTSSPNSLIATNKIQIVTKSEINLKKESLEVNVRTTPKRGLSISAGEIVNPYVKVVGTLAAPRLAVDEKGVLLSGGAAVATGGLSVLARAAWTRLSRSQDPCSDLAEEAKQLLGERFPDLAPKNLTAADP